MTVLATVTVSAPSIPGVPARLTKIEAVPTATAASIAPKDDLTSHDCVFNIEFIRAYLEG